MKIQDDQLKAVFESMDSEGREMIIREALDSKSSIQRTVLRALKAAKSDTREALFVAEMVRREEGAPVFSLVH